MIAIKLALKRLTLISTSVLLVAAFPASTLADTTPPDPSTVTQGPTQPTGADAQTYTYNPATGLWENAYYTWNPTTGQTSPKTPQTYSYNPATGHWDTTDWIYDAPSGKYVPNVVSVTAPPASAITNTGPNSTNTTDSTANNSGIFNGFYNATISNNIASSATTGNAGVSGNTTGGGATTGNANDIANIINLLQSSAGVLQGPNLTTFTANVNGNVQGDLTLDPSTISSTGPNSFNAATSAQNTDITVNDRANGTINNDVALNANSGNAAVSGNTSGGDATSGNANAAADVVNVINSLIGAAKGFVGVININGNLNGDILLPQDTINSLIASSGPSATVNTSNIDNANLVANLTNNQSINNNVNASAASGQANVSNNTSGGSATTGTAGTNLTLLNLTGSQVIGKDALLVFVNVMGNWVGMIVNAPAGSNAAALGGGITSTGPNSTNSTSNTSNTNATLNSTINDAINNNIRVNAQSGDASVTGNTSGGNATTGNAHSGVNLLNIEGSQINLSDWLGILFINVFGTWNGSFGLNTSAGNPTAATTGGLGGAEVQAVKAFQLSAGTGGNLHLSPVSNAVLNAFGGNTSTSHGVVLSTSSNKTPKAPQAVSAQTGAFPVVLLGIGMLGFAWIIGSTPQVRKGFKTYSKPVMRGLQTASTRLFTFLF